VPECFPFPSMSMSVCLYPTNPTLFDAVRPSPGWLVTDLYQDPDLTKDLRLRSRSWPRPQQGPSLGFNLDRDLCLGLALALGLYLPSSHFLLSAFPMKLDLFPQRYAFSYEFRKWNQSLLSIHLGWLLNVHHSPKNSMQPPVAGWAFSNPSFGKRKAGP
jgi:hypothetical protein